MGTRATVRFFEGNQDKPFCAVYVHCDGYPEGLGKQLKAFCEKIRLVNGISDPANVANGMGCLAAQFVAAIKEGAGHVYLREPDAPREEFDYHVRGDSLDPGSIAIKAFDCSGAEVSIP